MRLLESDGKVLAMFLIEHGSIDEESRSFLPPAPRTCSSATAAAPGDRSLRIASGRRIREKRAARSDSALTDSPEPVGSQTYSADTSATTSFGASPSDAPRVPVLRSHAKGKTGVVELALDGEWNRDVALKPTRDNRADDLLKRTGLVIVRPGDFFPRSLLCSRSFRTFRDRS